MSPRRPRTNKPLTPLPPPCWHQLLWPVAVELHYAIEDLRRTPDPSQRAHHRKVIRGCGQLIQLWAHCEMQSPRQQRMIIEALREQMQSLRS